MLGNYMNEIEEIIEEIKDNYVSCIQTFIQEKINHLINCDSILSQCYCYYQQEFSNKAYDYIIKKIEGVKENEN